MSADHEQIVSGLRDAMNAPHSPTDDWVSVGRCFVDEAIDAIEAFYDDKEWIEKGLAEWRDKALENAKHAEMARATARVAINHLQSVLNKQRTYAQQHDADTAARDWLLSIGSEPQ